jgi:hypothetical protein
MWMLQTHARMNPYDVQQLHNQTQQPSMDSRHFFNGSHQDCQIHRSEQVQQMCSNTNNTDVIRQHRITFAVFLKVLIRCLERSNQTGVLNEARLIIRTCCRGHKLGDPSYTSLDRSIDRELRLLIDKTTWNRARRYTLYYLRQQQRLKKGQVGDQRFVVHSTTTQGRTTNATTAQLVTEMPMGTALPQAQYCQQKYTLPFMPYQ